MSTFRPKVVDSYIDGCDQFDRIECAEERGGYILKKVKLTGDG